MFVAASSRCFPDLPLDAALLQLVELEYSAVEIMLHETDGHMKPRRCWPTRSGPWRSAARPTA